MADSRSGAAGRLRAVLAIVVASLCLGLVSLVSPQAARAATVPTGFDAVSVVANPNGWTVENIGNTIDGSVAGWNIGRIYTGLANATGVVVEYTFTTPRHQVTGLELFNNGGNVLSDRDGIGSALVEVFDSSNTLLFSGPLTAGNGAAAFVTTFPSALDDVASARLSNITNLTGHAAPDIMWRELRAVQHVSTPTLSTAINADGYSDDVTVAGTEGLAGTLDWTLYGPIPSGANDSCAGLSWAGAPVFATDTVAVTGDGLIVTTPPVAPTASGCYSYTDTLSGPSYTADAVSVVGQPAETFFIAPVPAPSISLVKSAAPSDALSYNVGQVITYSFVVTNTGNVPLTDVTVNDDAFTGFVPMGPVTCPGGNGSVNLAAGEQVTCTATYTIAQEDVDQGSIENTASATGTPPALPPVDSPPSTIEIPGNPAPAVSLVKTVDPQVAVSAGDTVTYSFLITNTGNLTLTDVAAIDDPLAFSGTGTLPAPTCPAQAASMLPGEQVTCTADYTLTQDDVDAGTLTNTATSIGTPPTGPDVTSAPSSAVVDITSAPAISLVKSAGPTTVTASGQVVTYTFLVVNTGNVTLSGVGVADVGFTGDGTLSAIQCPIPSGPLAPTDDLTCTANYTVTQADIDNGQDFINTAVASGTPPAGAVVESAPSSATVSVNAVSQVGLSKSAQPVDLNGDGRTTPGDSIGWTIVVTNTGATTLTGIDVTDPTAGPVTCPGDELAPGASMTCTTASRTVTTADALAGSIPNTADVVAEDPIGLALTTRAVATAPVGLTGLALTGVVHLWPTITAALLLLGGGFIFVARRRKPTSQPSARPRGRRYGAA